MYERVRCEMCGSELEDGVDSIIDHVVDGDCERIRFLNEIGDLRRELAVARTEAERYRQQYEALRAAVEDVADVLDRLRGAVEKARQLHCIDRDPYEDGRSAGWGTAVKWLRKALADHGGDER